MALVSATSTKLSHHVTLDPSVAQRGERVGCRFGESACVRNHTNPHQWQGCGENVKQNAQSP